MRIKFAKTVLLASLAFAAVFISGCPSPIGENKETEYSIHAYGVSDNSSCLEIPNISTFSFNPRFEHIKNLWMTITSMPGDTVSIYTARGKAGLKKFMNEAGVPPHEVEIHVEDLIERGNFIMFFSSALSEYCLIPTYFEEK